VAKLGSKHSKETVAQDIMRVRVSAESSSLQRDKTLTEFLTEPPTKFTTQSKNDYKTDVQRCNLKKLTASMETTGLLA